jgi:hypothetical protein
VQNYRINPDFDLFLQKKSGGPSPRAMDHTWVVGPRVHHGPHNGRRPELSGARPSGHSGARRLAAEAPEARGRGGDPSGWLTLGGEAVRWASGDGEQSFLAVLSVRGARGEEGWGGVVWKGKVGSYLI